MSRIAGLLRPEGSLVEMLACMAAPSAEELPLGTLGWVGRGPCNAFAGRVTCVLDGVVYNRTELGHDPTDAALLARLHEQHGFLAALRLLNGDFAAALHDPSTGTLWVGRDRMGVRPLYYLPDARGFAFASRPLALLRLPGVSREPNRQFTGLFAGSHYRYFDNDPDASPYAAIAQLPAAHALELREGTLRKHRWWMLEDAPDLDGSPQELAERYRELLLDAVRIRVRSARRPAFTLSGGMDSSSVLASAVEALGAKQPAFSTVYAGSEYDESDEIASMLDTKVEHWRAVRVEEPDVISLVSEMVAAHDEPVATATWLSHHVLCERAASEGFDVLFGGLGGDELNAGEYEHFLFRFADMRAAGEEEALQREVAEWQRHHDHPVFRKDWDVMEAGLRRLIDPCAPGRIRPDRGRLERYADAVEPGFYDVRAFEPVLDHPFTSYLKNRTYQDVFRETAPCCLRAEDRQTAARGMRNCDPFFDHRLMELMFRVRGEQKIHDGITKRLLREAMRGLLPEETRTRIKKTGWNAPADAWFSGSGREVVLELVESPELRGRGIYRVEEARRLIDEHDEIVRSGRPAENHMMFLWQLVNLELWLRWLDGLPPPR